MGDLNEALVLGTLGSIEASLELANIPYTSGGVEAAIASFIGASARLKFHDSFLAFSRREPLLFFDQPAKQYAWPLLPP